ncbi:MAG: long-chain fatty acid--CoA ligase [Thermodesulfobacteriota bacterium]
MSDSNRIENIRDFTLERNLDTIALKFKDEAYTYGDLELLSRHMSTWFTAMELKGEPVAFMLPNGFEILITYLACFKSGAVATPLSRRYSAAELKKVLIESQAKCLIIELDKLNLLEEIDLTETSLKTVYVNGVVPREGYNNFYTLLGPTGQYTETEINVDDPAVIFYTPGANGEFNGVVHSYSSMAGIFESTSAALEDVTENDKILVLDPQINISGFLETFTGLNYGAEVIVHEGYKVEETIPALVNERPTLMITHIGVFEKLLDSGMTKKDTFGALRGIYTGGKSISSEFQKKFYEHTGQIIQLGYGMTEAIWLTINRELNSGSASSIGQAVPGANIRIITQDGTNVSEGQVGEICVEGQMVTPGYWKVTSEKLQDGWFKTGDLGFKDSNGNIVIVQN